MENATKALLIAAAVLIVIVIIALGVRLLGSVGDTSSQAQTASQEISNASNKAIDNLQVSLNNDKVFNLLSEYIDKTKTGVSKSKVLTLLKEIEKYNKEVEAGKKDGNFIFVNYRDKDQNYIFYKKSHLTFTQKNSSEKHYSLQELEETCINSYTGTYKILRSPGCGTYKSVPGKQGMIDETRLGCVIIQQEQ